MNSIIQNILKILLSLPVLLFCLSCTFQNNKVISVIPAHSHNDYENNKPLIDALDCGFKSIEADVYLVGDSLFVAHNYNQIKPGRTLRNLYLNPLAEIIKNNNGSVYGDSSEIILLIDIKKDGLKSYKQLHSILKNYKKILTSYRNGEKMPAAISVIISGDRPIDYMQKQEQRYAGYDGRIPDLDSDINRVLMPLISADWQNYFKWNGEGKIPANEKERLQQFVKKAHNKGYMLRFWATYDKPGIRRDAVWNELKKAQVDLIGTNDLNGLQSMFLKQGKEKSKSNK